MSSDIATLLQQIGSASERVGVRDTWTRLGALLSDERSVRQDGAIEAFVDAVSRGGSLLIPLIDAAAENVDPDRVPELIDGLIRRASELANDREKAAVVTVLLQSIASIYERQRRSASRTQLEGVADVAVRSNVWEPQPAEMCASTVEVTKDGQVIIEWLARDDRFAFAVDVLTHVDPENLAEEFRCATVEALRSLTTLLRDRSEEVVVWVREAAAEQIDRFAR